MAAHLETPETILVITTPAGLEAEARQELRGLLPGATFERLFFKGNLLVAAEMPEAEALERVREAQTACVASATAVQRRVSLGPEPEAFSRVAEAAAAVGRIGPGQTFLVRCHRRGSHQWRSRDLEQAVAADLAELTGAVGEYEQETDWLVLVQVYQDLAYVGVNRPGDLIQKPLRKQRKYPPGERPLNRAQIKLREAFEEFGIEPPAGGRALDLGSAPGGWAAVLAESAREVVAVDPGELDPTVAGLPNVRHLRVRAETLLDRPEELGQFDLMTSDMNLDPADSARIMCQLAPLLKPAAPAIMTVKYTTRQRRRHEREARSLLSAEYEQIRVRRLPHNALETTVAMRRRGAAANAPK